MLSMAGIDQVGLKGHSYVLPVDSVKSATTLISFLPRRDLRKDIMVGFMGTRELFKLVRNIAGRLGPFSMNPVNVFMFCFFSRKTSENNQYFEKY